MKNENCAINNEESGYILVITVFVMVLMLLLFIAFFARISNNTDMSSATFWHDKSILAADTALPALELAINMAAKNGPLEYESTSLPAWYQNIAYNQVTAPVFSTWKNCASQSLTSGQNCYRYTANGFNISEIVQPTGLHNQYVCGASGIEAVYYNVYVDALPINNIKNGQSGAVIQAVYRLCVKEY
jgi:Tfp pilus assembly protein PilX